MNAQDAFGIVAMFYAVANLGSMGIELELREAITAFPNLDPRLLVMILLAVPVPVITWFALSKFFASQAGKTMAGGAAGLPVQGAK